MNMYGMIIGMTCIMHVCMAYNIIPRETSPEGFFEVAGNFLFADIGSTNINQNYFTASRRLSLYEVWNTLELQKVAHRSIAEKCKTIVNHIKTNKKFNKFVAIDGYGNWPFVRMACKRKGYNMVEVRHPFDVPDLIQVMTEEGVTEVAAGIYDAKEGEEEMVFTTDHKRARIQSVFDKPCGENGWTWEQERESYHGKRWRYQVKDGGLEVCRDLDQHHNVKIICMRPNNSTESNLQRWMAEHEACLQSAREMKQD